MYIYIYIYLSIGIYIYMPRSRPEQWEQEKGNEWLREKQNTLS